jgi:hypothetical protein
MAELGKHVRLQYRLPGLLDLQRHQFVAPGALQQHHEGAQSHVRDPTHQHAHVRDAVLGEHLLHFGGDAGEVRAHQIVEAFMNLHRSLFG